MRYTTLETLLRRDCVIVATALALITALSWLYILRLAAAMDMGGVDMTGFRMISTGFTMVMAPALQPWSATEFGLTFAMWAVMMIGMMTPSAAPMILIYARAGRMAAAAGRPLAATSWFVAGYLLMWTGFAFAATAAQWILGRFALLDPTMATASTRLGGVVLVAAGCYQWTPLKDACLAQCQSPLLFIERHGGFRSAVGDALRLGATHGLSCIGCCWALMLLLFVGGIMNVLWIAGLTVLALAEKTLPIKRRFAPRFVGTALVLAGVGLLVS
jgi:predicted metal-binding membrane protein